LYVYQRVDGDLDGDFVGFRWRFENIMGDIMGNMVDITYPLVN